MLAIVKSDAPVMCQRLSVKLNRKRLNSRRYFSFLAQSRQTGASVKWAGNIYFWFAHK